MLEDEMQKSVDIFKRGIEAGRRLRMSFAQLNVTQDMDYDLNPIWIWCPDCGIMKIDENNFCPRCGSTSNGYIL